MKNINVFIIGIITLILLSSNSCNFAPGSYPYAEIYKLKTKVQDLIKAVEKFKNSNSDYCVPNAVQLKDGQSDDRDDHWYHIYFYYKDRNLIIYSWVRQTDKDITSFAFVSVNEGLKLGNWKYVNKDFSNEDNKFQKEMFERRILNEIKKQIVH